MINSHTYGPETKIYMTILFLKQVYKRNSHNCPLQYIEETCKNLKMTYLWTQECKFGMYDIYSNLTNALNIEIRSTITLISRMLEAIDSC